MILQRNRFFFIIHIFSFFLSLSLFSFLSLALEERQRSSEIRDLTCTSAILRVDFFFFETKGPAQPPPPPGPLFVDRESSPQRLFCEEKLSSKIPVKSSRTRHLQRYFRNRNQSSPSFPSLETGLSKTIIVASSSVCIARLQSIDTFRKANKEHATIVEKVRGSETILRILLKMNVDEDDGVCFYCTWGQGDDNKAKEKEKGQNEFYAKKKISSRP